jgi:hypothetical protein
MHLISWTHPRGSETIRKKCPLQIYFLHILQLKDELNRIQNNQVCILIYKHFFK